MGEIAVNIHPGWEPIRNRGVLSLMAGVQWPRRFHLGTDQGAQTPERKNLMKTWFTVLGAAVLLAALPAAAQVRLDARTTAALLTALDDERQVDATYTAVTLKFGPVTPFSQIAVSERQHQSVVLNLMLKYGVPVPDNPWDPKAITVPDTLAECCALGVRFEQENVAMYTGFLTFVTQPDIRNVFTNLRSASLNQHLPAFQNCNCTPRTGSRPQPRTLPGGRGRPR